MNNAKGMWWWSLLAVAFLASACVMRPTEPPGKSEVLSLADGEWKPKADNLVFVLDSSSSMLEGYEGVEKFAIAKRVLTNFNMTMPALDIKAAIRIFGHDPALVKQNTMLAYELTAYSRPDFAASLEAITPVGGPSPLEEALDRVAQDLKNTRGKIALIVVSDGWKIDRAPAMAAAAALQEQYGDRLCLHTVLVGDDPAGRALLADLSKTTDCGRAVTVDDLATGPLMTGFVRNVMLEAVPGTAPEPALKPQPEPALKSRPEPALKPRPETAPTLRPETAPKPRPEPEVRIPFPSTRVSAEIRFDLDRATLRPEFYPVLEEIYATLCKKPHLNLKIQGHACSKGPAEYNMDLSLRRARTVMDYMRNKGIASCRLKPEGYGENRPVATNRTEEGRARNRRVEIELAR